jgi:hypothetical protein
MHSDRMIALAEAAHQLSISWERAWRALLKGDLAGEKRATGDGSLARTPGIRPAENPETRRTSPRKRGRKANEQ